MSWSSDNEPTVLPAPAAPAPATGHEAPRFAEGQALGPYRIERLLGRGGMGEVYEAEHLEHGRRVALKVLNQRLAGADDRARFLREGRLAASLNHPNTVYVFGSEVIGGNPVISMELVAGGTLKDVVDRDGPMAPSRAVDAILQVVAGLDAALACGVLHRDVKPSNCFVDPGGTVKVGDFGLSIPLDAPDVTLAGEMATLQGTPQFAAPEQLRGQRLDMRADVYAVGATLYYLLTGRAPFEDRDLMSLLMRVSTEAPAPPARPGALIHAGLSSLVLRCLAKDPAARPSSYADLERALHPFSSAVPAPASPGLRLVAGVIDVVVLGAVTAPLAVTPVLELTGASTITASIRYASLRGAASPLWLLWVGCSLSVLYFALLEGRWGRSLGKLACGLQVSGSSGAPISSRQAVGRAFLFALPNWAVALPVSVATAFGSSAALAGSAWLGAALTWGGDVVLVLLFSSIRRRNGFAAWHDLATGTRVVMAPRRALREPIDTPEMARPAETGSGAEASFGPYAVIGTLGPTANGVVRVGFDAALRRKVWVHDLPPGEPAVGARRARLGRPGRLRWLNGRRTNTEAWDAYEAPDGAPMLGLRGSPRPWREVRHWVADLARELEAASADDSMPVLALDRVWITRSSQARLLEYPAPGPPGPCADGADIIDDPQVFLARVADWAGAGGAHPESKTATVPGPLPRGAQAAIDALRRHGFPSMSAAAARAAALADGMDRVTRPRRAASILLANLPLLAALLALAIAWPTAARVLRGDVLEMSKALVAVHALEGRVDAPSVARRQALEVYTADRFGAALTDEATWRDRRTVGLLAPLRPTAARILSARRAVGERERRAAQAAAERELGTVATTRRRAAGIATVLPAAVLLVTASVAVLLAFVFRGGLLFALLGLAVVLPSGADVSRVRATWRAAVAWSPILLGWIFVWAFPSSTATPLDVLAGAWWLPAAASLAAAAGAAWAVRHPARGPAERLSGTYLVPR